MRFVTETRLKQLEELLRLIPDPDKRSFALHVLQSVRSDIDDNYAEIQRPISLSGIGKRIEDRKPRS